MQFGLAFGYFINRTGGFTNLLLVTVCNFIPVVGPIVALGYRAEVAQALLRDDERRRHPKFDFNRFGEYLSRGIWPFLIGLVLVLFAIPLIILGIFLPIFFGTAANQPVVGMIVSISFYLLALVLFVGFSAPMTFHAELAGRFDLGGAFRFAKEFWTTVGGLAILTGLLFIPLSFAVTLVSVLACFVGIYPANSLIQMAGQHLFVQLYVEYLERGGEPIREFVPRDRYDDDEYEDESDERERGDDEDDDDRPRRRLRDRR